MQMSTNANRTYLICYSSLKTPGLIHAGQKIRHLRKLERPQKRMKLYRASLDELVTGVSAFNHLNLITLSPGVPLHMLSLSGDNPGKVILALVLYSTILYVKR